MKTGHKFGELFCLKFVNSDKALNYFQGFRSTGTEKDHTLLFVIPDIVSDKVLLKSVGIDFPGRGGGLAFLLVRGGGGGSGSKAAI